MAFCCLIYPFQWQYILIPLLPGIYKELLDAPVPYIAGMNTRSDEKSLILQNYESVLVVLLDSGEFLQNEGQKFKKLPDLDNIEAKIETIYNTTQKQPDIDAANQICGILEKSLKDNFLNKIPSIESSKNLSTDLESIKVQFKRNAKEEDREFIEKFAETQLFATYVGEHCNILLH